MPRYLLRIQYDGSDYFGWQRQNEGKTVQGCIEKGLSMILQAPIDIHGAGRTDSGVHAENQAAHFDYNGEFSERLCPRRINSVLPDSITIDSITQVADNFHARFDALYRQYRYQITLRPRPLLSKHYWLVHENLNTMLIEQSLTYIKGVHSFENFAKTSPDVNHMRCEVLHTELVRQHTDQFYIRIRANRFLRHMVRFLVGSIIQVASGKMRLEDFHSRISRPDIPHKSITAPAKGLILEAVEYPADLKLP